MDPSEKQRERELASRRDNEEKDLEVERTIGPRPLEGFSGGHTTWTAEQDDAQRAVHRGDEEASRRSSEAQVTGAEPDGE